MPGFLSDHFARIEDGANSIYGLNNLSSWVTKYTYHGGRQFNYLNHEYQPLVIDDPAKTVIVVKCAQTGLSEIFARWGMAACTTQPDFTLMWTFPSSTDAENFTKTRLDPMIEGSPEIRRALSTTVNSVALKQFGKDSFAYVRGTISDTGGLSVPADLLIHDEYDKSDMDNIAKYLSRLQHKPTKMRRMFSTPTVDGYGISSEAETAKRKRQMWKCSHCNHTWLPSFELDVKIPGYDGPKKEITKVNLKSMRWQDAQLLCPHCGLPPSFDIAYREWVVENPMENYSASAWFITPFTAPNVISMPYLVGRVAEVGKWSEFCNQQLGLVAEDAEEMLTEGDIRKAFISGNLDSSEVHYMGCDMGLTCHILIGRRAATGELLVVHRERVNYTKFEERRRELIRQYRVLISVHDVYPYTDIVKRITDFDFNAYGALYVVKASTETHSVREHSEEEEEGKLNLRLAMINRHVTFDAIMNEFKAGTIVIPNGEDSEDVVTMIKDQKRVQKFDKHGGIIYVWEKSSQGNDHFHHALAYLYTACNLRGTAQGTTDIAQLGILSARKSKW